jgi:N-acetylmuramoyl-L-alanine amidase
MSDPKYIFVHCSATPEGRHFTAADIDRWHKNRGWAGIGYHKVVLLDGTVERGRDDMTIGAHVRGHNTDSLAIVYIGGVDGAGKAKDTRTPEQRSALLNEVLEWMDLYDIPVENVYGHYEFAAKACPSFDMNEFRNELEEMLIAEDEMELMDRDIQEGILPAPQEQSSRGAEPQETSEKLSASPGVPSFWQHIVNTIRSLLGR